MILLFFLDDIWCYFLVKNKLDYANKLIKFNKMLS
jgi:hypothetical protein